MDPGIVADTITNEERYPTLSERGARLLEFMREHPHAPIYRNQSGNRLQAEDLVRLEVFEREVRESEIPGSPGAPPEWVTGFAARCFAEVPFYRRSGSCPARFEDIPSCSRADLSRDIAQFVPDPVPLDRLINFRTSGTTGHPLVLASHPVVAASYLAFHRKALRRFGVELFHGAGQVGVVLVGYQRHCFTYTSVTPALGESGLAKINLHPEDWRQPEDRAKYLDALAPEVYAGDPISLAELAALPLRTRPRAVLSTSMALLPAWRDRLEKHFSCPVLDLYSMNEAGPIAVFDPQTGGHVLLQHRLYVEVVDAQSRPVPPGVRGEVALTGGFNFCLPLLRYRTGDFAALEKAGSDLVLRGLEGRPPVRYRARSGEMLNNIEVTHSLQRFAIPQFTLRQNGDGDLEFRFIGPAELIGPVREALLDLFGPGQRLEIERVKSFEGKVVQYTSALPESLS